MVTHVDGESSLFEEVVIELALVRREVPKLIQFLQVFGGPFAFQASVVTTPQISDTVFGRPFDVRESKASPELGSFLGSRGFVDKFLLCGNGFG